MDILPLFSKRQKKLRGETPDVYTYNKIPQPLRVQIVHVWQDALGSAVDYADEYKGTEFAYRHVVDSLCREYGVFTLPGAEESRHGHRHYLRELADFFLQEEERILDVVEVSLQAIDQFTRSFNYLGRTKADERADAAIAEVNARFKEHAVGYQFIAGEIIRVDSELLHAETVKPALALLRSREYAGAEAEFLKAHQHYRNGHMKEALAECLKALESVMKAICKKRNWKHDSRATTSTLLQVLFDQGLIPSFWNQHFSALRSVLESGVPTARNRLGGHGQGAAIIEVPEYLVAFVLHSTASAIVFLTEAEHAMR